MPRKKAAPLLTDQVNALIAQCAKEGQLDLIPDLVAILKKLKGFQLKEKSHDQTHD